MFKKLKNLKSKKGVVVIPTILMLSGLITVIALTGSLIIYLLNSGNYSLRLSGESFAISKAGIQDAIMQIIRNNNFVTSGSYSLNIGNGQAAVTVNNLPPPSPDILQKEIISTGSSSNRYRKQKTIIQIDKRTGQLQILSTNEIQT